MLTVAFKTEQLPSLLFGMKATVLCCVISKHNVHRTFNQSMALHECPQAIIQLIFES